MGQLIWTLGIIATALVWNNHEAKKHEPSNQNAIVADTVVVRDTITIHADTSRSERR